MTVNLQVNVLYVTTKADGEWTMKSETMKSLVLNIQFVSCIPTF